MSRFVFHPPQGFTAAGFQSVKHAFEEGFTQGKDKGAALAIYYKGSLVVNLWGGMADASTARPWKEETYGHFWSGTKFMSSVVIAQLVERGLLDYAEKVSTYWPDFAQNGKENITLDSLLSHSAGVSLIKENYQLKWMREQPHMFSKLLASQSPLWEPGSKHGYSGIILGPYLNEIVKRVDVKGRSLAQYFNDEIATPFGIDFHIGLPRTLHYRACRSVYQKPSQEDMMKAMERFEGDMDYFLMATKQPSDFDKKHALNEPEFASLPCGSTHGIGTAKAAAKFAGILGNGGTTDGQTMLTENSIGKLQKPLTYGVECISSERVNYGRGTHIYPAKQGDKTWYVYGHIGFGGQVVLSDPHYGFGFAYCTNYMDPIANFGRNRWRHLLDAVYQCVGKIEGVEERVQLYEQYEEFLSATGTNVNSVRTTCSTSKL